MKKAIEITIFLLYTLAIMALLSFEATEPKGVYLQVIGLICLVSLGVIYKLCKQS